MAITTKLKNIANYLLRSAGWRLDSLTAERDELARLCRLEKKGHFTRTVFPILPQFKASDPLVVLTQIQADCDQFDQLTRKSDPNGFDLRNEYYTSPDAEVLYSMVRLFRPSAIVEVGSGHSTKLFRAAISDAEIDCKLTSIDPAPRRDIVEYSDRVISSLVEEVGSAALFESLQANDFLFIDSSHLVKAGNDVVWLLLSVLPILQRGVIIHLHDIFLPYEYPKEWIITHRWNWNEQYLVQAFLTDNAAYEVLWAGHYLQRSLAAFQTHFPHIRDDGVARSLWLRKITSRS
jgi:predicted O-methyltransferase YrrM